MVFERTGDLVSHLFALSRNLRKRRKKKFMISSTTGEPSPLPLQICSYYRYAVPPSTSHAATTPPSTSRTATTSALKVCHEEREREREREQSGKRWLERRLRWVECGDWEEWVKTEKDVLGILGLLLFLKLKKIK